MSLAVFTPNLFKVCMERYRFLIFSADYVHFSTILARVALAFVALFCLSCVNVEQPEPPKQCHQKHQGIPGWYKVEMGQWNPTLNWGYEAVLITPPEKLHLTSQPFSSSLLERRAWAVTSPGHPIGSDNSYWTFLDNQTVEIDWSEGFGGLKMVLKLDGVNLTGEVSTFWEFRRMIQRASLRLTWIPCPDPTWTAQEAASKCS